MSSESSDDDFSYTNTASLLKNIAKKINIDEGNSSVDSSIITINEEIQTTVKTTNSEEIKVISDKTNNEVKEKRTGNRRTSKKNDSISTKSKHVPSDACIVIPEIELDKSFDIISTIDACLERSNSRRKSKGARSSRSGKGKKRTNAPVTSPRRTRNSKRSKSNTITIDTIEIDPDYPVLNSEPTISDEVNYDLTIKVLWKSQHLEKFNVRRFQKLENIFKFFAKKENVSEDRLLFTMKDKIVSKSDSAYSLGLTAASIIEGGILSEKSYLGSGIEYKNDTIELKILLKNLKKPLVINMKVTDQMNILMSQCAEKINVPIHHLKFYFDGDIILPSDSPTSLQLEGGECIDCVNNIER